MQNRSAAYAEQLRHSGVSASAAEVEIVARGDGNVAEALAAASVGRLTKPIFRASDWADAGRGSLSPLRSRVCASAGRGVIVRTYPSAWSNLTPPHGGGAAEQGPSFRLRPPSPPARWQREASYRSTEKSWRDAIWSIAPAVRCPSSAACPGLACGFTRGGVLLSTTGPDASLVLPTVRVTPGRTQTNLPASSWWCARRSASKNAVRYVEHVAEPPVAVLRRTGNCSSLVALPRPRLDGGDAHGAGPGHDPATTGGLVLPPRAPLTVSSASASSAGCSSIGKWPPGSPIGSTPRRVPAIQRDQRSSNNSSSRA
jgi:hypothetical protein